MGIGNGKVIGMRMRTIMLLVSLAFVGVVDGPDSSGGLRARDSKLTVVVALLAYFLHASGWTWVNN